MITEILNWGIGTVPVRAAEALVQTARFLRNPQKSGRVTIQEVYEEEKNVIETVTAGKGLYAPIGQAWKIQSKLVSGDKGQTKWRLATERRGGRGSRRRRRRGFRQGMTWSAARPSALVFFLAV